MNYFLQYPDAYQAILEGVKGDTPEKKLSCQFIPRFFKYFPNLSEQAIDAQLDLCEEDQTLVSLIYTQLFFYCSYFMMESFPVLIFLFLFACSILPIFRSILSSDYGKKYVVHSVISPPNFRGEIRIFQRFLSGGSHFSKCLVRNGFGEEF